MNLSTICKQVCDGGRELQVSLKYLHKKKHVIF